MLNQEAITQQLALLAAHRRTLAHLMEQAAQYGGEVFAPPQTANGIAQARKEIRRIKTALREGGVAVENEPNDDAPPVMGLSSRTAPTPGATFNQPNWTVGRDVYNVAGDLKVGVTSILTSALHQLRAPVGDFVGREREIDELVQALSRGASGGAAAAISGVCGMGGIGKTELAYVVAHRLKNAFPDAQLLIELRGTSSSPLTLEQALQAVILSFEHEAKLPDELGQLKGLYNSVLSGKRVLILADDARDAGQVRPLLPPPGCALLVTSRTRFSLSGMAALDLEVLPPVEAELLLEICSRIGEHTSKLARLCGYLPLALRVSASLLKSHPSRRVAEYLKQLSNERTRLAHLRDPRDRELNVEASLLLSYTALEEAAQMALRQISAFPASFDCEAARAVVEVPPTSQVDLVLEELCLLSLLEYDEGLERYSLHDLVRVFAAARLEGGDAVRLRHARHYARVAERASNLYNQGGASLLAGLALFDQERVHIDAGWGWARERAGDQSADALLLDYANATAEIGPLRYDTRRERIPQFEAQLAAARRSKLRSAAAWRLKSRSADVRNRDATMITDRLDELSHRGEEGAALNSLGNAHAALGDTRQAISFYEQALVIVRERGNRGGEGAVLGNLGNTYADLGDTRQAISFYEQALVIERELGDRRGEGTALGSLGNGYYALGDTHQAIACYKQHLLIAREISDRRGEGAALGNLGNAYAVLGDARKAINFYEQRLVIAREIGDRRGEGNTLGNLGNAHAALGDTRQAITCYQQALVIAREIGDRRNEAITSCNLSEVLEKQGDLARAAKWMQIGVDLLRVVEHPAAVECAAQLEQLRQRLAAPQSSLPIKSPDKE